MRPEVRLGMVMTGGGAAEPTLRPRGGRFWYTGEVGEAREGDRERGELGGFVRGELGVDTPDDVLENPEVEARSDETPESLRDLSDPEDWTNPRSMREPVDTTVVAVGN